MKSALRKALVGTVALASVAGGAVALDAGPVDTEAASCGYGWGYSCAAPPGVYTPSGGYSVNHAHVKWSMFNIYSGDTSSANAILWNR